MFLSRVLALLFIIRLWIASNKNVVEFITPTMLGVKIINGIPNTYNVIFVHKNKLTNLAFIHNKSDMYSYSILFDLDYNYAWRTYDNLFYF